MDSTIIIGILSFVGTMIGTLGGIVTANKLTNYRIAELEKKVEKHNSVVERIYNVERDLKTAFGYVDEIKGEIKNLKGEIKGVRETEIKIQQKMEDEKYFEK